MIVYKFGGASIADEKRMQALLPIIQDAQLPLVIVISALGKMTNALEELASLSFQKKQEEAEKQLHFIEQTHYEYAKNLVEEQFLAPLLQDLEAFFAQLNYLTKAAPDSAKAYDFYYDQIVSVGELLSSTLFSHFLNSKNVDNQWVDARQIICTDANYRQAGVDENLTKAQIEHLFKAIFREKNIVITQGFIGGSNKGYSTTLGREGSDYTAALFAHFLNADSLTIWKDTEGFLNADPKKFTNTEKIQEITYHEVVEMSYYGAQIIHPKTIKPLQNSNIPLFVKCFLDPTLIGTHISNKTEPITYPPLIVLKENQVLLQLTSRDFSFINESSISEIYKAFFEHGIKINMIQKAAISLVICVDAHPTKIQNLIKILEKEYRILRNEDQHLLTIRHYQAGIEKDIIGDREIILEQRTRSTLQIVY